METEKEGEHSGGQKNRPEPECDEIRRCGDMDESQNCRKIGERHSQRVFFRFARVLVDCVEQKNQKGRHDEEKLHRDENRVVSGRNHS